jgi:hypothetical protein
MKFYLLLLSIVLFCVTCKQAGDVPSSLTTISISKSFNNIIHLDSIIESYTLIELETSDTTLVGAITQMEYLKGRFYISDRKSERILVFDKTGRAIIILNSVGRGPDGFSYNSYFQVDSNHRLFVLSGFRGIVSFDSSGKYITSIDHNVHASYNLQTDNYSGTIVAFALSGSGDFYLWNGTVGINKDNYQNTFLVYRLTKESKITDSYLPINHGFLGISKIFYGVEGNYLLHPLNGNDTIYRANQYGINPAYFVDFESTKIPVGYLPKTYENYLHEISRIRMETKMSTTILAPIETEDFLFFQFHNEREVRFAFYSLSTKNTITGTFPFRRLLGWPSFSCNADNKIVGYIDPIKASNLTQDDIMQFSTLEMEIYNKIKLIDPTNNPVLIILDLKDF